MLAQAVMPVVITLVEKIILGMQECITAVGCLKATMAMTWKCHRDELIRNNDVERGKPRKRETQIW